MFVCNASGVLAISGDFPSTLKNIGSLTGQNSSIMACIANFIKTMGKTEKNTANFNNAH